MIQARQVASALHEVTPAVTTDEVAAESGSLKIEWVL